MADYNHQQQDFRAGLQHLANRSQEASVTPAVLIHQRRQGSTNPHRIVLAEAGLEAHLQHQTQILRHNRIGDQLQLG